MADTEPVRYSICHRTSLYTTLAYLVSTWHLPCLSAHRHHNGFLHDSDLDQHKQVNRKFWTLLLCVVELWLWSLHPGTQIPNVVSSSYFSYYIRCAPDEVHLGLRDDYIPALVLSLFRNVLLINGLIHVTFT